MNQWVKSIEEAREQMLRPWSSEREVPGLPLAIKSEEQGHAGSQASQPPVLLYASQYLI